MKRVIIVGGGYAGISLAKRLDKSVRVQLVEPRTNFVHNIGGLRAAVKPTLLRQIVVPYNRLLKNGTVIQSRAVGLTQHSVKLADGRELHGDVIIVATGSTHNLPFKPQSSADEFARHCRETAEKIKRANSIAIIGGGPVGVELAGEIRALYRRKPITLVSRSSQLCQGFTPKLGAALLKQLSEKQVSVVLNASPKQVASSGAPYGPLNCTLSNGQSLQADLVFNATGASIDNRLLISLNGTKFTAKNRAIVDPWWRLPNAPSVLVLGDAAESGDPMTAVALMRQVPHVAEVVKTILEGRNVKWLPPYSPWPANPLFVPIGPTGGASVLPIGRLGTLVGPRFTSLGKGKGLLISRYRKLLGYPAKAA